MSLSKFESVLLPGTIEEADHAAMVLSDQLRELMSADKATDTEEYALAVVGQGFRNTSWAMEHERDQLLGTAYGLAGAALLLYDRLRRRAAIEELVTLKRDQPEEPSI